MYHVIWWTITIGSLSEVAHNIFFSPYSIKFLFYVVFQAVGVYFNLYVLIPKYLYPRKYVSYCFFLVVTILITAACIVSGYFLGAHLSDATFVELYGRAPSEYFTYFFSISALPSTVASMTLGMSVKLAKNWIQAERRQQVLEKEKLESELRFLKSQFNPHFLFNTINSIFVLIHKNQDIATESLAKFSDLLRYQLYECNEHFIPLDRELDYIRSFIELSRLRIDPREVSLHVDLPTQNTAGFRIAPFILMPFIENAFKHVKKGEVAGGIVDLTISISDQQLYLNCQNTKAESYTGATELMKTNGIGLVNVKRRLTLIYPGSHQLTIQDTDASFDVKLAIVLNQKK